MTASSSLSFHFVSLSLLLSCVCFLSGWVWVLCVSEKKKDRSLVGCAFNTDHMFIPLPWQACIWRQADHRHSILSPLTPPDGESTARELCRCLARLWRAGSVELRETVRHVWRLLAVLTRHRLCTPGNPLTQLALNPVLIMHQLDGIILLKVRLKQAGAKNISCAKCSLTLVPEQNQGQKKSKNVWENGVDLWWDNDDDVMRGRRRRNRCFKPN